MGAVNPKDNMNDYDTNLQGMIYSESWKKIFSKFHIWISDNQQIYFHAGLLGWKFYLFIYLFLLH